MNIPAQSENTSSNAGADQTPKVLFGRFMLPDQSEHPFQISQISPDGATMLTSTTVAEGVEIVAYIDEIGRVEARIIAVFDGGLAVQFLMTGSRRQRIAEKLEWLSDSDPGKEQRRHARFEPKDNNSHLTMPDGRIYKCEVIDISLSGAAVKIDILPNLGTNVLLGKMRGRVVRSIEGGIAIEFLNPLSQSSLSEHIK